MLVQAELTHNMSIRHILNLFKNICLYWQTWTSPMTNHVSKHQFYSLASLAVSILCLCGVFISDSEKRLDEAGRVDASRDGHSQICLGTVMSERSWCVLSSASFYFPPSEPRTLDNYMFLAYSFSSLWISTVRMRHSQSWTTSTVTSFPLYFLSKIQFFTHLQIHKLPWGNFCVSAALTWETAVNKIHFSENTLFCTRKKSIFIFCLFLCPQQTNIHAVYSRVDIAQPID